MSSKATKTNLVPIGRIVGTFGIQGELKCDPSTAGRTLFFTGATLQCERAGSVRDVRLANVREHKGRLLVMIEHVDSINEAKAFIGAEFYAAKTEVEQTLDANEYLAADLLGCTLRSLDGTAIGSVSDVRHYPASDMLIVHGNMIPLVRAFIKKIDLSKKEILVDLPPGLLDD